MKKHTSKLSAATAMSSILNCISWKLYIFSILQMTGPGYTTSQTITAVRNNNRKRKITRKDGGKKNDELISSLNKFHSHVRMTTMNSSSVWPHRPECGLNHSSHPKSSSLWHFLMTHHCGREAFCEGSPWWPPVPWWCTGNLTTQTQRCPPCWADWILQLMLN